MDSARFERLQALFHAAADLPPEAQHAFVAAESGEDRDLEQAVLAMLEEDARGAGLLDRGLASAVSEVLGAREEPLPAGPFGPYRLLRVLGEGGMGVVYLGQRADLGSVAAIKILRDASLSPARRERFLNEQRTLAQLQHPAIAQLLDADSLPDGTPWFVMEYVDGLPLIDYCRARQTTIPGRLQLFRSVCQAVQHAHQHAVIHRDLKPSNILVKPDGTIKLLDFGIAKHLETLDAPQDQTRTGLRMMTPAYAAPEQLRGDRVGIHTDVYSLGVVLYELLTDRLPFDLAQRTPAEAAAIVTAREPERPSVARRRAVSPTEESASPRPVGRAAWADLDVLCLTAMHQDPARRYRTVDALMVDIDHFLHGEPLEARPDTVGYRVGKFVRRNRAAVLTAVTIFTLVIGLVAFYTIRLAQQRSRAVVEAAKAQQVSEFLIGLFGAGDPFGEGADSLTLPALLARGVSRADTLAGQPDVQAEMLDVLGRVYTQLSQFERSDSLLRRALAIRERDPAHALESSHTLANLGALYRLKGEYDSAEAFMNRALAIRERGLPPTHPDLASTLNDLGVILSNKGDYKAGEAMYRRALEIRRQIYSGPNILLATTLNDLGVNQANQGDYEAAEQSLRESAAMSASVLGADHASLASDLGNLGVVLDIRGNYAAADSVLTAALRISRLRLGDLHYETAFRMTQLGGVLRSKGDLVRAEAVLREALAVEARILDPTHRNTAITRIHLAAVLQAKGDLAASESLYHQAVRIMTVSLGPTHEFTATSQCRLANLLHERAKMGEAERLFRTCLAVLGESLPADHDILAGFRSRFGAVLSAQSRFAEAESLLVSGYETLRARFGTEHRDTKAAALRLAAMYKASNRPVPAGLEPPGGSR